MPASVSAPRRRARPRAASRPVQARHSSSSYWRLSMMKSRGTRSATRSAARCSRGRSTPNATSSRHVGVAALFAQQRAWRATAWPPARRATAAPGSRRTAGGRRAGRCGPPSPAGRLRGRDVGTGHAVPAQRRHGRGLAHPQRVGRGAELPGRRQRTRDVGWGEVVEDRGDHLDGNGRPAEPTGLRSSPSRTRGSRRRRMPRGPRGRSR